MKTNESKVVNAVKELLNDHPEDWKHQHAEYKFFRLVNEKYDVEIRFLDSEEKGVCEYIEGIKIPAENYGVKQMIYVENFEKEIQKWLDWKHDVDVNNLIEKMDI